ncbi:unnamed protein product, partial [Polarella glacialis]
SRPTVLGLTSLLCQVIVTEAVTRVQVKNYVTYAMVCCCSCLSFICAFLVVGFLYQRQAAASAGADAWQDFDESLVVNTTNSSAMPSVVTKTNTTLGDYNQKR